MAAYRYYSEENKRHALARATRLTRERMVLASKALFMAYNLPEIPVRFSDNSGKKGRKGGGNWSWFWYKKGQPKDICYGVNMLEALTVAHEVAHYIHFMEQKAKRAAFKPVKTERSIGAGVTVTDVTQFKKERPHGPRHIELVDECVGILVKQGFMQNPLAMKQEPAMPVMPVPAPVKAPSDPAAAFFDALPAVLFCPCCKAHKPKEAFGVRVMKRDDKGVPTVVRRQSYCRECR